MTRDEFDHRLDDQFARLRDSTMKYRPDLRDDFDACLPPPADLLSEEMTMSKKPCTTCGGTGAGVGSGLCRSCGGSGHK